MNTKRQYEIYPTEFRLEAKADELAHSTLNSDERTERIPLRKEVKKLIMVKEILKKASTFFPEKMK